MDNYQFASWFSGHLYLVILSDCQSMLLVYEKNFVYKHWFFMASSLCYVNPDFRNSLFRLVFWASTK